MTIDLTTDERQFVLLLLQLMEAAVENHHSHLCECALCETLDKCTERHADTFDSLQRKMEVGL